MMKQIDKQYLCYTCISCNRLELETFTDVYRCKNYIKKERVKDEIQFRNIRKSGR